MTLSRRKFIKAGILTSIVACSTAKFTSLTSAQKRMRRADAPDPLDYYNKATFQSYVNSYFRIYSTGRHQTDVRLVLVEDFPTREVLTTPEECFRLLFSSPAENPLPQGTYDLNHAALGTFGLFIVPRIPVDGKQYYEAVFNRRSAGFPRPSVAWSSTDEPITLSKKPAPVQLENPHVTPEAQSRTEVSPRSSPRQKILDW